jgi:hypothetical protein
MSWIRISFSGVSQICSIKFLDLFHATPSVDSIRLCSLILLLLLDSFIVAPLFSFIALLRLDSCVWDNVEYAVQILAATL